MTAEKMLPNEVLLHIFEQLQDSTSTLLNAMQCCRRWHRLASVTLYTHVSIDSKLRKNSISARFATQATCCDLIRSLSLRITQVHLMGFSILSTDAFDRLSELCDVLARMHYLRTFAISFEDRRGQGFAVPSFAVVSILQNLPKSVINLNLDCDHVSSSALGQPHICQAVSAMLPRLRSLRLRTSLLCSGLLANLFPQAAYDNESHTFPKAPYALKGLSALEYAHIHLTTHYGSEHESPTVLCYSGDKALQGSTLAGSLHDLHKQGLFPRLRQFTVIGRVDATPSPQNDNWDVFKVRVLNKTSSVTITLPWCARGGSSSLYMIRDEYGDWFGSSNQLFKALEGPLRWTNAGIRARSDQRHYYNDYWKLDHSHLASRKSVIEKFGVSFRLWKHETATGTQLLHARTTAGFSDTAAASQMLPSGWRWVPEGPWNWTIEPILASHDS